ncbi:hypothetical protein Y5S_00820 [Alcanivorax nanhaiticus]|uniref:DUF4345 domain-containing protein n=1 Tax=Alcanivorax nanhaiticus TaxID=1177154 RepID=A0A095SLV3_9GAMM|nr:DUF4345 family protein [Alcanivorax nanhaiticus]KGD65596.1 hypothetical protein Y5S_00820 [Alcanivorax nanhaiticus]
MQAWLVRIVALVFLAYGVGFVFVPGLLMQQVVGEIPVASSAWIDLRATYGGLSLGVGLLLAVLSMRTETLRAGTLGVVFLMAGMAGGRIVGMVLDGSPNGYMMLYLLLEIVTAALAVWTLRGSPKLI